MTNYSYERRTLPALWWLMALTLSLVALWYAGPIFGRMVGGHPAALAVAALAMTIVWVCVVIGLVRNVAGLRLPFILNLAGFIVGAGTFALVYGMGRSQPLLSLAVIFTASFLGCVVSIIFRERNILLPVALIAPLVDYWTVTHGLVANVIRGTPEVLESVSAATPDVIALRPLFLIGAGDFLFMAMFLSAAERLMMNPGRTALLFAVLVSVTLVFVLMMGSAGMPGMVAIGLGFVAANLRYFKLTRSEIAITSVMAVIVGVAIVVIGLRGAN